MKLFTIITLVICVYYASAQDHQPKFSFKDGLGVSSPDSSFTLNFRFRTQIRAVMNTTNGGDFNPESYNAFIPRCRFIFRGNVISPKFGYYLQMSVGANDLAFNSNISSNINTAPNIVRDAVFFYRPNKDLEIGFGQTKLPGNRERVVSSGSLQFADRSIVNTAFNIDRDFGLFITQMVSMEKKSIVKLKASISSGEGRNSVKSDNGLCYTGRLEYLPLGNFKNNGDYFEGDIEREETPKIAFGGTYSYNHKAMRTNGQLGNDLYASRNITSMFIDMIFKYKGFGMMAEYMNRNTDTALTVSGTKKSAVLIGDGFNAQLSYCFKSNFEIVSRFAIVMPKEQIQSSTNQQYQMVLGVNKYFNKHKFKLQGAIQYFNNYNRMTKTQVHDFWSPYVQVEIGI